MTVLHASCVEVSGTGVLLRGPARSGKSDLALRLIDGGARLVADDRVRIEAAEGVVRATPPGALAGLIEVRGLGIVAVDAAARAGAGAVALVVDLVPGGSRERLPELDMVEIAGVRLPRLVLDPFEASAPAKVRIAVRTARSGASLAGALGDRAP